MPRNKKYRDFKSFVRRYNPERFRADIAQKEASGWEVVGDIKRSQNGEWHCMMMLRDREKRQRDFS